MLEVHRYRNKLAPWSDHPPASLADLLDSRLSRFVRAFFAQKRDPRRSRSLHMLIQAGDGAFVDLGKTVDAQAHARRLNRRAIPWQEDVERILDVASVLAALPPELRVLAERLKEQSLSEAAADLGTPRSTLQGRVRLLRRAFERAGFGERVRSQNDTGGSHRSATTR